MDRSRLRGMGVAMVTPFNEEKAIDFDALKKLTRHLVDGGTDYLVVQGTTGESPVLSAAEKQEVLNTVVVENDGKCPVVFGIGGNNTAAVVKSIDQYDLSGVDAILSASPYYNKPTQEGIYQHYAAMAAATDKGIILYNVPGRTSSNMLPETTLRLANDFENIVAVKEACGNMEQIMKIISEKPDEFLVISGDDPIALPLVFMGGDGVISVVGNAFPKHFSQMIAAGLANDKEKALELHYQILPVIGPLFEEGNPGGVKEILAHLGLMSNYMRLPLVNVSESLKNKLIGFTDNLSQ